MELVMQGASK